MGPEPSGITVRPRLALAIIVLVGTANYLDRHVLSIALPLIRAEFRLSDAALGLLAGPAFAIVYAVFAAPLGLLADRIGHRRVIAGSLAVFSLTTLLSGLAGSLGQITAARLATGVGEAGATPACTGLICELYPPERRAGPLSVFAASSHLGLVLAFLGGGWIAEHHGWRMAFYASATFGLLILVAMRRVLGQPHPSLDRAGRASARSATLTALWAQPAFRWVAAGAAIASISGYAAAAFAPSFLARSHHMTPAAIGLTLALLVGTFGWAGTALPGVVTDRWFGGDVGTSLKLSSLGLLLALPFQPIFYLAADVHTALLAAIPPVLFGAVFVGPCYAAAQHLAPPTMRASAAAQLLLVLNLVGLGLGPQLVGVASDLLRPRFGEDALRYALLFVVTGPIPPATICFWQAGRLIDRTVRAGPGRPE